MNFKTECEDIGQYGNNNIISASVPFPEMFYLNSSHGAVVRNALEEGTCIVPDVASLGAAPSRQRGCRLTAPHSSGGGGSSVAEGSCLTKLGVGSHCVRLLEGTGKDIGNKSEWVKSSGNQYTTTDVVSLDDQSYSMFGRGLMSPHLLTCDANVENKLARDSNTHYSELEKSTTAEPSKKSQSVFEQKGARLRENEFRTLIDTYRQYHKIQTLSEALQIRVNDEEPGNLSRNAASNETNAASKVKIQEQQISAYAAVSRNLFSLICRLLTYEELTELSSLDPLTSPLAEVVEETLRGLGSSFTSSNEDLLPLRASGGSSVLVNEDTADAVCFSSLNKWAAEPVHLSHSDLYGSTCDIQITDWPGGPPEEVESLLPNLSSLSLKTQRPPIHSLGYLKAAQKLCETYKSGFAAVYSPTTGYRITFLDDNTQQV